MMTYKVLVSRKELAEQIGVHPATLSVWLENYKLNRFLKRSIDERGTEIVLVNVCKTFCKIFWKFLRSKKDKYKTNFNKYYHEFIFEDIIKGAQDEE